MWLPSSPVRAGDESGAWVGHRRTGVRGRVGALEDTAVTATVASRSDRRGAPADSGDRAVGRSSGAALGRRPRDRVAVRVSLPNMTIAIDRGRQSQRRRRIPGFLPDGRSAEEGPEIERGREPPEPAGGEGEPIDPVGRAVADAEASPQPRRTPAVPPAASNGKRPAATDDGVRRRPRFEEGEEAPDRRPADDPQQGDGRQQGRPGRRSAGRPSPTAAPEAAEHQQRPGSAPSPPASAGGRRRRRNGRGSGRPGERRRAC